MTIKKLLHLEKEYLKKIAIMSFGVFFGIYFTYLLIHQEILNPILASALTGLIGSIALIKKWDNGVILAISIYCGSFAGMGSVFNVNQLIITSFIVIVLLLISTKIFNGFGGKLGFIAYLSSILTEIIIVLIGNKKLENFSIMRVLTKFNPITEFETITSVIIASSLGLLITIYLHHYLKKSAVFSSAFPSFMVALLLSFTNFDNANLIALTFFSASFAGMVIDSLLQKKHFPILIIVHALTIILFKKNLGAYGGALGTIAFFSVFILVQVDQYFIKKTSKNK